MATSASLLLLATFKSTHASTLAISHLQDQYDAAVGFPPLIRGFWVIAWYLYSLLSSSVHHLGIIDGNASIGTSAILDESSVKRLCLYTICRFSHLLLVSSIDLSLVCSCAAPILIGKLTLNLLSMKELNYYSNHVSIDRDWKRKTHEYRAILCFLLLTLLSSCNGTPK